MRLRTFLMIGLAMAFFLPLTAGAQQWTAVGSTGAIDEGSLGLYATNDAGLFFAAGATGNVTAYYNVVNNSGSSTAPWTTLEMTSADGSATANVTAVLYRVPRCSGSAIAVCSVLSSESTTSPTCTSCTFSGGLDFANNAYFVKVILQKTSTTNPAVYQLRLF